MHQGSSPSLKMTPRSKATTNKENTDSILSSFSPRTKEEENSGDEETDEVSGSSVTKSEWEAMVMRRFPDILELYERTRELRPGSIRSYSEQATAAKTWNKHAISSASILRLIMEYLDRQGFHKSRKKMEHESKVKYIQQTVTGTGLAELLHLAKRRIGPTMDIFGDTILQFKQQDDVDTEVESVDHLQSFTENEEEMDIWDQNPNEDNFTLESARNQDDGPSISAGTLNQLIKQLIESNTQYKKAFFSIPIILLLLPKLFSTKSCKCTMSLNIFTIVLGHKVV